MKVLVTGMTPYQCGSDRTKLDIRVQGGAYINAIRALGHEVDQRPVHVGQDLSRYDRIIAGISQPHAIAAGYLFSFLEVMRQRAEDVIFFVDDWQVQPILNGFKTYSRIHDNIWRLDGRFGRDEAMKDRASFEEWVDRLASYDSWAPVLVSVYGNVEGDLSKLGLPAEKMVRIDPTPLFEWHEVPFFIDVTRRRRWVLASLATGDFEQARPYRSSGWECVMYGSAKRGKAGIGKGVLQEGQLPPIPESDLAIEFRRSWGVVATRRPTAGTGWWRNRYPAAVASRSVLSGPVEDARLLGDSYVTATDVKSVVAMTDAELNDLVDAQADDLKRSTWTRDQLLQKMSDVLEGRLS